MCADCGTEITPYCLILKLSSPGFFWAQQLLRTASYIYCRPKELLLTAVPQGPGSIPDQLASVKLAPRCYRCRGKEWTISSTSCLSSDLKHFYAAMLDVFVIPWSTKSKANKRQMLGCSVCWQAQSLRLLSAQKVNTYFLCSYHKVFLSSPVKMTNQILQPWIH